MGKRITIFMTVAVLAGFGVILLMNVAALLGYIPPKYISPNDVRGMAIEHNSTLYTLNFAQQNTLVDIFNRAIPVNKGAFEARQVTNVKAPQVTKIIIYRFNQPDIEIKPVGYVNKNSSALTSADPSRYSMVFSAPIWNPEGLLEETASDELQQLLLTTYDH